MYKLVRILLPLLLSASSLIANAQDLGSIGKSDPVQVTGGLSVNQIAYAASGLQSRRDPYTMYLSGNLNFNLWGWSVPLSVSYSNQEFAYQQPFNQYGLHPTYKWVSGHLGWASMNFSPYTLSGHLFRGAGVELSPEGGFHFSAMWGRLQDAVSPVQDTLALAAGLQSTYERNGWGFKTGYRKDSDEISFSLFKAQDQVESLPAWVGDSLEILPEENLVMSLSGQKQLFKRVSFAGEIAASALSRDRRLTESDARGIFVGTPFLFKPTDATEYYQAYKGSLSYSGSFYTVGVAYERIDPGYQTLGAYFFNNDIESISLNTTTALFQGKVNLGLNLGTQRDDLDDTKLSNMRRLATAISVNWIASERLNINAGYNTFQTITNIRPQLDQLTQVTPYDNLDTLNFTQISRSANINTSYQLSTSKAYRQALNLNLSMQTAADEQGNETAFAATRFYNSNGSYSLALNPIQASLTAGINYSLNTIDTLRSSTLGPTVSLSKALFNKQLKTSVALSHNQVRQQGELQNRLWTMRLSGNYSIQKKHSLNLSLVGLNRGNTQVSESSTAPASFTEFTATLGYSYRFGTKRNQPN